MSVRVCGRKVRWQKPIKIHVLIRALGMAGILFAMTGMPSLAADKAQRNSYQQASTGGATPCPLQPSRMEKDANIAPAPNRTQRSAGTPSTPALALALALGLRNVSGPMVQSQPRRGVRLPPPSSGAPLALRQSRTDCASSKLSANIPQPRMLRGETED